MAKPDACPRQLIQCHHLHDAATPSTPDISPTSIDFSRFSRFSQGSLSARNGACAVDSSRWFIGLCAAAACLFAANLALAETIGDVSTAFKLISPNHKVVVEAYDDPKVTGVTCYVSRARTGGLSGAFGVAEDKAEASIACRQVGPVTFTGGALPREEEIFSERMSVLFKRLRVVRMVDSKRNTLVYLTYSDRLIDGSPANSVTAVPVDRATAIPVR